MDVSSPGSEAPGPPPDRLQVIVVEGDPSLSAAITGALPAYWQPASFPALGDADGVAFDPDIPLIVVLGPSQGTPENLNITASVLRDLPSAGAVLITEDVSPALLSAALRAGINDALPASLLQEELAPLVVELSDRLNRAMLERAAKPATGGGAVVTTVFSPKGGVGKSVTAVNLAAALAQQTGEAVAIMDLDLQFGDVAVMLRLQPVHTFTDAAYAGEGLDQALLRSFMLRHDRSGVYVLSAPTSPSEGDGLDPAAMLHVLDLLKGMFSHVVVDTSSHLSELVLQAITASDNVVLVTDKDVPSVKGASLGLQVLDLLQFPLTRVLLVLNRSDSRVNLSERDVEKALEMRVDLTFPSEVAVPVSVNTGMPVLVDQPRSRFSAQVAQLAQHVLARSPANGQRGWKR